MKPSDVGRTSAKLGNLGSGAPPCSTLTHISQSLTTFRERSLKVRPFWLRFSARNQKTASNHPKLNQFVPRQAKTRTRQPGSLSAFCKLGSVFPPEKRDSARHLRFRPLLGSVNQSISQITTARRVTGRNIAFWYHLVPFDTIWSCGMVDKRTTALSLCGRTDT